MHVLEQVFVTLMATIGDYAVLRHYLASFSTNVSLVVTTHSLPKFEHQAQFGLEVTATAVWCCGFHQHRSQ